MKSIRERLSYANVVATLALFVALGGGAYAASHGSFVGADGTIHGCVAKHGGPLSITRKAKCPKGKVALTFQQRGVAGPAGAPGRSALTPLGAGETETGAWGSAGDIDSGTRLFASAVTFPIPLTAGLDKDHVIYVTGASTTHCPGVGHADSGFLCVYQTVTRGVITGMTRINKPTGPYEDLGTSTSGFLVISYTSELGSVEAWGTWAVTG